MTIEISTAIIISVLSLGFSVFMGLKSNKRTDNTDLEERVRENTRINMKLDAISNNTMLLSRCDFKSQQFRSLKTTARKNLEALQGSGG